MRLAELCAATSLFTDLGTGQFTEHGLRTCLVAMRLAAALDLPADVRCEVFYVWLLRFLGCTADAYQLAAMAGGDEVRFLAEAALAKGDIAAAIAAVLVDILEMTDEEIDAFRHDALWPGRVAAAPTIPSECRVEDRWAYQPGKFDAIIAATLLLQGSDSVPSIVEATERAEAAIPGARVQMLDGHGHFAHMTDPAMVTALIRKFIRSARERLS